MTLIIMSKLYCLSFWMLVIASGCGLSNGKFQLHDQSDVPDSSLTVDISQADRSIRSTFDTLSEKIAIVPLETNDQSILSDIDQIIPTKDYIYVLDRYKLGSVAIFNIDGSFAKRLPTGPAPHEIARATRICYPAGDSVLYVHDEGSKKIKKFTRQGDYIGCDDDKIIYNDFAVLNGKYVFSSPSWQSPHQKFSVCADDSTNTDYWILGNDYKFETTLGYIPHIREGENCVFVMPPRCNSVYCYDGNSFVKKYEVITNKEFDYAGCESIGLIKNNLSSGDFIFANDFIESNDYQLFRVSAKDVYNLSLVVRHRKSDEFWAELLGQTLYSELFYNCIAVYNYGENVFCGYLLPEQIKPKPDADLGYRWDGSNPGNLISEADMEKLRSVKPDDNPIIVLFKLKSEL